MEGEGDLPPPLTGSRGAGREAAQDSRFAGAAEARARAARMASLLRSILADDDVKCRSSLPRCALLQKRRGRFKYSSRALTKGSGTRKEGQDIERQV